MREVSGFGDADVRASCNHVLLGGADIRPALQQSGGHPGWNLGRQSVFVETTFALNSRGILPQKQCNLVLRLLDLLLQSRNRHVGGIHELFRLL